MRNISLLLGVAVLSVAACAKRPVPLGPVPTPARPPVVDTDSADRARADSIARARADSIRRAELARQQADQDSLAALREREQREAARNSDAMAVLTATVYFEYDQSTLSEAATTLLNAKVPVLQGNAAIRIRITGHTDERGSSEYNLALGLRRAAETKAYLVANGIEASRIKILSMGEEQPAVQGMGEESFSKNRRAEFAPMTEEGEE